MRDMSYYKKQAYASLYESLDARFIENSKTLNELRELIKSILKVFRALPAE